MRVVVTGGHGFLGGELTRRLLARGTLRGEPVDQIVLADLRGPGPGSSDEGNEAGRDDRVRTVVGDLSASLTTIFAEPVDVVFHLAAAVSSACEIDFDLGMRTNLEASAALLEAARAQTAAGGQVATVVFSSSVAVYGNDPAWALPSVVSEATLPMPQSSYGAQKFAVETLLADYTRKGFVDGRSVRLMTVAVRPGVPNAAASSFVSGIIREPLAGIDTTCPVPRALQVAIASPRRTVDGLLTIAEAPRGSGVGELSGRLPVNLPALTVSVGEMLDALTEVAGEGVAARVRFEPDPDIERIVASWPAHFDHSRAHALGLEPDPGIHSVIRQYMTDHPGALAQE